MVAFTTVNTTSPHCCIVTIYAAHQRIINQPIVIESVLRRNNDHSSSLTYVW